MGLCDRVKGRICTKKRENIFLVQRRERGVDRVYLGVDKKEVYYIIKITTDCTGVL